jgi:hypothetical protein
MLLWFGLRPRHNNVSLRWFLLLNALLWGMAVFYIYILGHAVMLSASAHFETNSIGEMFFVTLSTFSLATHIVYAPIAHAVAVLFFYMRGSVLSPLEKKYERRYRRSVESRSQRNSDVELSVSKSTLSDTADGSLQIVREILQPARTTLLNRDAKIITGVLLYMVIVQNLIILLTRSRHMDTETTEGLVFVCVAGVLMDTVAWVSLALLMLVTRVALRQIQHYLLSVEKHSFTSPEELFSFHLALRSYFTKNTKYFTFLTSFLMIGTATYTTAFVFWLYAGVMPYLSHNRIETTLYYFSMPLYVVTVMASIVWCLASVNDLHERLRSKIVEHQLFSLAARQHLLSEIDMFPVSIPVFGIVFTSNAFKRLLASVIVAVLPGIVQALIKARDS